MVLLMSQNLPALEIACRFHGRICFSSSRILRFHVRDPSFSRAPTKKAKIIKSNQSTKRPSLKQETTIDLRR
jgi:hypothetical protein